MPRDADQNTIDLEGVSITGPEIMFHKPTNEMVRRLIPLYEQGDRRGSF